MLTGRNTPTFAKDTVYRFMKMVHINWIRFTSVLCSRIIRDAILPLNDEDRVNVLIIADSMFERNRSKKVELLAKVYDHAKHAYRDGFRMLTLGWSDGSTLLPINSVLLTSEKKTKRINEAEILDRRTAGYKRRNLSMTKGTKAMLELLKSSKAASIPAKYVLFDSWFTSPSTIHAVKGIGYDVVGMVKKHKKCFSVTTVPTFLYLKFISRIRSKNKRKEYLCIISTDITWIQAFQVILQMFSKLLSNDCELSEDKITELTDAFMSTIPSALKERRKVA
ncbi:MAG: transposase [Acetivibrio ethanolgignens]